MAPKGRLKQKWAAAAAEVVAAVAGQKTSVRRHMHLTMTTTK